MHCKMAFTYCYKSDKIMAYIPRYVDKGICTCCDGSGWEKELNEQIPIVKVKREKPTQFDLGKCSVCGGSGRRIEHE